MKKVLLLLLQYCIFLACFVTGSFAAPFHLRHVIAVTADGTRIFIWDGVVLMALALALILLIQASRHRLWPAAAWTVVALLFAVGTGFALRLGFLTI